MTHIDSTVSPTGRAALTQLLTNEQRRLATHVSAVHPAARQALLARQYIATENLGARLVLTDTGRAMAEAIAADPSYLPRNTPSEAAS